VANTTNLAFPPLEGEALVVLLAREGVCVSAGSACPSGSAEPSHVLLALGRSRAEARAALRFSLSVETVPEDVERVLTVLPGIAAKLRSLAGGTGR